MAFIDRTVVKRLLIERLIAQLALDSSAAGVNFLVASQPDPKDEADGKWCRIVRFAHKANPRVRQPDGSGAERVKGPQTGSFTLVLGVACRCSVAEESDFAWDSAAGHVERSFDGAALVYPAAPATTTHSVEVLGVEAVQDAADDDQRTLFTGVVTVTGKTIRVSGDSLEVRPAAV